MACGTTQGTGTLDIFKPRKLVGHVLDPLWWVYALVALLAPGLCCPLWLMWRFFSFARRTTRLRRNARIAREETRRLVEVGHMPSISEGNGRDEPDRISSWKQD